MKKHFVVTLLVLLAGAGLLLIGCESLNGPDAARDEALDLEESFDVTSTESQESILKSSGVNLDSANGFFLVRWSEVPLRFKDSTIVAGHASAVAFEKASTPRDRKAVGLDMGTVSLLIGSDKFDLRKLVLRFSNSVRYGFGGGPQGGKGGPRGGRGGPDGSFGGPRGGQGGPQLTMVNIPFVGGGSYQFDVTGSDKVAAMKLDIKAPAKLVAITGLADKQEIDATQDLKITWDGDAAANDMALVIAPLVKRGRFGSGQRVQPIFQTVNAAAGSYTVTAPTLQDLLSKSGAKALSVHLSQGVHVEVNDAKLGKILVSAGADDRVLLTVK